MKKLITIFAAMSLMGILMTGCAADTTEGTTEGEAVVETDGAMAENPCSEEEGAENPCDDSMEEGHDDDEAGE